MIYTFTSSHSVSCDSPYTYFPVFLQDGRTALWTASFDDHLKIVELLINAGAAVDVQDKVC